MPNTVPSSEAAPLWAALQQVRSFSFRAATGSGSQTDWNGQASGSVSTELSPVGLVFREFGQFTPHGRSPISIRNQYLWTLEVEGVRLSHLRHGPPVELLALRSAGCGIWKSPLPHLCGADTYALTVEVIERAIRALWSIQGPRKNERLDYLYHFHP